MPSTKGKRTSVRLSPAAVEALRGYGNEAFQGHYSTALEQILDDTIATIAKGDVTPPGEATRAARQSLGIVISAKCLNAVRLRSLRLGLARHSDLIEAAVVQSLRKTPFWPSKTAKGVNNC
ncbi:MAG: hypothetical protein PF961_10505 [Planctomycetota bacterium]|jgi:hypothetical protein|nr:hypothetical protein [Planctomycetota bacterium]